MIREPLVRCEQMTCAYGDKVAIHDIDLVIRRGDFIGIVGPSGSGKSTLLKCMVGALSPVRGSLVVSQGTRIAYVPQVETVDWNFPVTVLDVIVMTRTGARPSPRVTAVERTDAMEVLSRLGLDGLHSRHIRDLSGGQQQRVFIARALFHSPDILVLDEPTSGVDVRTRHEVLHLVAELHAQGLTVVLSTHDLNGLAAHLPRIVCLNRTVVADGSPTEVITPAILERTYGAPMEVLSHGGMPVVVEHGIQDVSLFASRNT